MKECGLSLTRDSAKHDKVNEANNLVICKTRLSNRCSMVRNVTVIVSEIIMYTR